jgi:putative oxidoreductase
MDKYQSDVRGLLRIAVGFLFFTHGAQKILGWFGGFGGEPGGTAELFTRFGVAGLLELFGGLLIMAGLFTRPAAFILSGQMAVAYVWIHTLSRGLWPWSNGGELAALYSFVFLYFAAAGGGSFSLDSVIAKRKEA